jgi:serine/threonine protein kinase
MYCMLFGLTPGDFPSEPANGSPTLVYNNVISFKFGSSREIRREDLGESLYSLLEGMFQPVPDLRLSLESTLSHPFWEGRFLSKEEAKHVWRTYAGLKIASPPG